MSRTIDVSDLPESFVELVEEMVAERRRNVAPAPSGKRGHGWFKGQIFAADDAFAPMTDAEIDEIDNGPPGDPLQKSFIK